MRGKRVNREPVSNEKREGETNLIISQWSGPLPPPEVLEQYKSIHPDILQTILWQVKAFTEANLETIRNAQAEQLRVNRVDEQLAFKSLDKAFWITLSLIVLSGVFAYFGMERAAVGLCTGGIGAIVGLFIYRMERRKR